MKEEYKQRQKGISGRAAREKYITKWLRENKKAQSDLNKKYYKINKKRLSQGLDAIIVPKIER